MKQITLMDAYVIEILRSNGVTNEEIIKATEEKQLENFKEINENFDYTSLYPLKEDLRPILEKGYQVKFLTMPGLMNLLKMKHNKEKEKDYELQETSLINLSLTREEREAIEKWLSPNWIIEELNGRYTIKPTYS